MNIRVRLYRAGTTEDERRPVATITLTDRAQDASPPPIDLAPIAHYFLRHVEAVDPALGGRIREILHRDSIEVSRGGSSIRNGIRARGDGSAKEPYGSSAYWRAALGLLEVELPLELDAVDLNDALETMDWHEARQPGDGSMVSGSPQEVTPRGALSDTDREAEESPVLPSDWLTIFDPDPRLAEQRYEELRRDVTRFLEWDHDDPESAAQEAILRALHRLAQGAEATNGLRAYVFGFAKNIIKEGWRLRARERPLTDPGVVHSSSDRQQEQLEARLLLQQALGRLSERDLHILLEYVDEEDHTAQCRQLGVTAGNLRVIIHRIRNALSTTTGIVRSSRRKRGETKR